MLFVSLAVAFFSVWQGSGWLSQRADNTQTGNYAERLNPRADVKGAQTDGKNKDGAAAAPLAPTKTPPVSAFAPAATPSVPDLPTAGPYRVVSVSDGDTFRVEIDGRRQTVRLIGVDTPEISRPNTPVQCYARQASAFTKDLLTSSFVHLATDSQTDDRDRYGRLLRYVYLTDGRLVQHELLKGGYAFAYTRFPFTRAEEFVRLQLEAQTARQGLWRDCKPAVGANGVYSTGPTGN